MIVYALIGIPLTGFFLRCVGNEMTNFFAYLIRYIERRIFNREAEKLEIKCVYISSCLAVIMIVMGGIIFTTTEKRRTLMDGIYFSFVTLTTIGFGDMVHESSNEMNGEFSFNYLSRCVGLVCIGRWVQPTPPPPPPSPFCLVLFLQIEKIFEVKFSVTLYFNLASSFLDPSFPCTTITKTWPFEMLFPGVEMHKIQEIPHFHIIHPPPPPPPTPPSLLCLPCYAPDITAFSSGICRGR